MSQTRKHYSPQEKVSILRTHLVEHVPISDLCDKHQINPTVLYAWLKQFFERGAAAFERQGAEDRQVKARDERIAALQGKLQRKDEVIAELMEEHVKLKKEVGDL